MTGFVETFVFLVRAYLLLGCAFGVIFVLFLVSQVDPTARGGTLGFRMAILPGLLILWPLMLVRLVRGSVRPVERNQHRSHAAMATRDD